MYQITTFAKVENMKHIQIVRRLFETVVLHFEEEIFTILLESSSY